MSYASPSSAKIPAIVLGGTGYVAGELLRLIAGHPQFELAAVMSDSQPGESVGKAFPHLASAYTGTTFKSQDEVERLIAELPSSAVFGAAPHGVSACNALSNGATLGDRVIEAIGLAGNTRIADGAAA